MKPVRIRKLVLWLIVILAVIFAVYRVKFRPLPVIAHTLSQGPLRGEVMGTGTLEARVKTIISPRLQEQLTEVLVDQGDTVQAGQVLARLDESEIKRQVDVATASLAAARASLERVKTDEARALAVLRQARLDQQRAADLLTSRINSQGDFDKAVEQLNVAEADGKRSAAAIVEAGREVETAEKNLAYQQERLGFTRMLSPYAGLIVRRDRDPGGVVVPGTSILQLVSTNEIWVSAWVDETALAGLAPGQTARVVFRSEPTASYPGEVARLGREADRETRELLVDVRVKVLPKNWAVGQRAEAYIETGRKDSALILPSGFVSWRAGQPGVFVNEQGRARWRAIKLGLRGLESVEVTEGLSAGEVACRPREVKQPMNDGQRVAAAPPSIPQSK
jgi:HlyD family secretion protein